MHIRLKHDTIYHLAPTPSCSVDHALPTGTHVMYRFDFSQSWESLPVIDGDRDRGKGNLYPHNRLSQLLTVHAAAAFVIHDWVQERYSTHALNITKKTCGLGVQSAAQRHNVHNTHTWHTAMLVAWQIVLS